jgi:single-strand DNA-binding protein
MSIAKIVISGRVVRVPEKRFTPNANVAVTEFAIAVESAPRNDGQTETNFVKVITWRDLAERCSQEIKKGDLVAVDGRLQINNYQTSDGQRKRDVEIDAIAVENLSNTLGSSGGAVQEEEVDRPVARAASRAAAPKAGGFGSADSELDAIFASEDEIPF